MSWFGGTGPAVGMDELGRRLLVAWLSGQAIGWFYGRFHGVLSYSQNFVQALVLLSMVVCVVLSVVGDSLARAFGLAAALALVRFRTPVKDARDTAFLFLAVAAGMAAGAGQALAAGLAVVAVGTAASWLGWTGFGLRSRAEGMLRLRIPPGVPKGQLDEVLRRHCHGFALAAVRSTGPEGPEERVYDVALRDGGEGLVRALHATGWVSGVSLLPQARVGEG